MATARRDHVHVTQVQLDPGGIQIGNAGVPDRRQDAAKIRIAGKKGRLDQRRMGHRISDLQTFGR
ncbi:hypothetical protein D9M69_719550 [compost metagenome]